MPIDNTTFRGRLGNADQGEGSVAITAADTPLDKMIRSLFVETGGTVKFTCADGSVDTWTVADKFIIPIAITQVWSTGTTATGLHGIY